LNQRQSAAFAVVRLLLEAAVGSCACVAQKHRPETNSRAVREAVTLLLPFSPLSSPPPGLNRRAVREAVTLLSPLFPAFVYPPPRLNRVL
jgi:hypothetical protein